MVVGVVLDAGGRSLMAVVLLSWDRNRRTNNGLRLRRRDRYERER